MANRYWVGGTASWDATAGTKWATTSGGAGGSAVPTSADDVFFDAASGAVTVSSGATSDCKNLNFTGFTGTFDRSNSINIHGSLTFSSSMTIITAAQWNFLSTASETITFSGQVLGTPGLTDGPLFSFGSTGTWTFQDAISIMWISLSEGTIVTNNNSVRCDWFTTGGASTRALTLGSTTWTSYGVSPDNTFNISGSNFTLSAGTSTIIFAGSSGNLLSGGKTFNNVTFSESGSIDADSTTISTLTVAAGKTLRVHPSGTQTISTLICNGTSVSHSAIESSSSGVRCSLVVTSASCSYVDVIDTTVTGSAAPIPNAGGIDNGNNAAGSWQFNKAISVVDTITLIESKTLAISPYYISVNDTATMTEVITRLLTDIISINDVVTVTENKTLNLISTVDTTRNSYPGVVIT